MGQAAGKAEEWIVRSEVVNDKEFTERNSLSFTISLLRFLDLEVFVTVILGHVSSRITSNHPNASRFGFGLGGADRK